MAVPKKKSSRNRRGHRNNSNHFTIMTLKKCQICTQNKVFFCNFCSLMPTTFNVKKNILTWTLHKIFLINSLKSEKILKQKSA